MEIIGKAAINPGVMWAGKGVLIADMLAPFAVMNCPGLAWGQAPAWARGLGWGLYIAGCALIVAGTMNLGKSLRLGLPRGKTGLHTGGLYAFSRNPIYAGFYPVLSGVGILAPHPVVWALGVFSLAIHHWVILAEERFLEKRFGAGWERYRRKVRRYI